MVAVNASPPGAAAAGSSTAPTPPPQPNVQSDPKAAALLHKSSRGNSLVQLHDEHGGPSKTVDLAHMSDADRELAAKFGYNPVFKREFGYLATFSFAVSISGLFATVTTTFIYPLSAGGTSSAIWGWLIAGAGCMCIAASVAELVSAYPTSGGLYYTVSRLAPPHWVPSVSWLVGWLNLLGQIAGIASSEYGSAQLLLAAVSMGTGFEYLPTAKQTVGVMAGLTVFCGLINSLPTKWLEKLTRTYVIFHIAILISCCIALLVKTENKHSATFVFTDTTSHSGWNPPGFAWLFGFLSVSWTMTDYDATAHITEEIAQPEIKAPFAIFWAMAFTYVAGFLFNIVLSFCMGDATTILKSPVAQPVAQIYYNSLGRTGGIFFTVCAFVILQFVCWSSTQACARTFFAFSRDKLVPGSQWWVRINRYTGIPLNAVWITVVLCVSINLIALGSYTAISGVFNICAICLDWSYCIPIACKIIWGQKSFQAGPWNMGRVGYFVNAWACIWTLFVSIIFMFPTIRPVTANNMNYAIVFLTAVVLAATLYWYVGGRKWYTGPLVEAHLLGNDTDGEEGVDGTVDTQRKTVFAGRDYEAAA